MKAAPPSCWVFEMGQRGGVVGEYKKDTCCFVAELDLFVCAGLGLFVCAGLGLFVCAGLGLFVFAGLGLFVCARLCLIFVLDWV